MARKMGVAVPFPPSTKEDDFPSIRPYFPKSLAWLMIGCKDLNRKAAKGRKFMQQHACSTLSIFLVKLAIVLKVKGGRRNVLVRLQRSTLS